MPSAVFHGRLAELPKAEWLDGAIRRTAMVTDGATIVYAWLQPGPKLSAHHESGGRRPDVHPFDQTNIVISGRVAITLGDSEEDGETYEVGPGEVLYIPSGIPHGGRVIGDEPVFVIEVFAPVREDYMHLVQGQPLDD